MYSIRAAGTDDIEGMCALELECFSSPWSREAFVETMRSGGGLFFVCEYEGSIVGYAGAVIAADECSVTNVAVNAPHRRRGISRRLLGALEREAVQKGALDVYLEVRVSNLPAVCAYEAMGYERCGIRRRFYTKPVEDAYVYKKELKKTGFQDISNVHFGN